MNNILNNLLQIFEKNKNDPFVQYGIAIEYRNLGDFDKALEFFQGVYKSFPDYVPNYYHLAQTLERLGRGEEASRVCLAGITVADKAGDAHAASELQQALELMQSESS